MRVAFIGGLDRLDRALTDLGRAKGIEVEVHYGDVRGRGADALAAIIRRSDHVIVVTGTNSHGGVRLAKQFAHDSGARVWIMRACGLALAKRVLDDIASANDEDLRSIARAA
jgi:hypothetical protein